MGFIGLAGPSHRRNRRLKGSIPDVHRATAIEAILQRLDGEGMPAECMSMVHLHAKRTAAEWRDNRDGASETEARLRRKGVDNIDINAEVFVQARASFEMFDQLAQLAHPADWIAARDQEMGTCKMRSPSLRRSKRRLTVRSS